MPAHLLELNLLYSFQEIFPKDVFIIEGDAINPPAVNWHSPNELIISATQKTTKVPIASSIELQLKEYEGIKISYEIH